jgi:hypothetical protein
MVALDAAAMPSDSGFRDAVREHVEFGSHVAMQNSNAESDHDLHPLREVPRWTWTGDNEGADIRCGDHAWPILRIWTEPYPAKDILLWWRAQES